MENTLTAEAPPILLLPGFEVRHIGPGIYILDPDGMIVSMMTAAAAVKYKGLGLAIQQHVELEREHKE